MPLYLQENFTVRLSEQLRRGELDAIIVALPFSEPVPFRVRFTTSPFVWRCRPDIPLGKQSQIAPDQIEAENLLVLGNGNCFRDQVVQACPRLSVAHGMERAREGS